MMTYNTYWKGLVLTIALCLMMFCRNSLQAQNYSNYQEQQGEVVYKIQNPFYTIELRHKGKVKFSADGTAIENIEPGGYLKFSKSTFGNKRTIHLIGREGGYQEKLYFVGKKKEKWHPEGENYLKSSLEEIFRISGIGADTKVWNLYQKGGAQSVLQEISKIDNSRVKSLYFSALLGIPQLTSNEINTVCVRIGKELESETEKGRLFRESARTFLAGDPTAKTYFFEMAKIASSNEKAEALYHILQKHQLSEKQLLYLFATIRTIDSSVEKRRVLSGIDRQKIFNNAQVVNAYFATLKSIDSNFELSQCLQYLLKVKNQNPQVILGVLSGCQEISSSYEKARVLKQVIPYLNTGEQVTNEYFKTVISVSSSHEKGEVLRKFIHSEKLTFQNQLAFYKAVSSISSSYEKGSVLREVINRYPASKIQLAGFFDVVAELTSNVEKGGLLRALSQKEKLSEVAILGILELVPGISSSLEKAEVLLALCKHIDMEHKNTLAAYQKAASTISSSMEFRRVMDALYKE
ncbi:hypothetical protein AAG747_24755 [Rapidithrix thailandica]|uniref:HEAT repeat domain-containing protein n=1 Tax=Rapidithrix thailandica TaxID=413964 RepID=A0AAW9SJY1_9BACT